MALSLACTGCGAALTEGARFCAACGAQVEEAASCLSCKAPLQHGAKFCGGCGAEVDAPPVESTIAPPATCRRCNGSLAAGAAFCGLCGEPVNTPAPASEPRPRSCNGCGAELREGAKFCRHCGTASAAAPASVMPTQAAVGAPASPPASALPARGTAAPGTRATARPSVGSLLTVSSLVAAVGILAGAAGLFLDWFTFSAAGESFGAGPFEDGVRWRLSDWLGTGTPVDGLAVILLLVVGGVATLVPGASRFAGIAGGLLIALGAVEYQYIRSEGEGMLDIGLGLYAVIGAGILLTISMWLPAKRLG